MSEWLGAVTGFSIWVKVGWVVFPIWCLIQFEWYRQTAGARAARPPVRARSTRERSADPWRSPSRHAAHPQTAASHAAGSSDFLKELGIEN
jgi:hypothetical protein